MQHVINFCVYIRMYFFIQSLANQVKRQELCWIF